MARRRNIGGMPLHSHGRNSGHATTIPLEALGVSFDDTHRPVFSEWLALVHGTRKFTVREVSAPASIDGGPGTPHHGDVSAPLAMATNIGDIRVAIESEAHVLLLAGEIDDAVIAAYEEAPTASRSFLSPGDVIDVVDLTEVTYFSSAGVSFLLRQTKEARKHGHRPTLRGLANPARRILQLTGVTELFDVAG
jgi:anti-anti-sigma factor